MDGVAQKQFNLQNMTECLLGEQLSRFIDSNAVQSGVFMAQNGKLPALYGPTASPSIKTAGDSR
jgi:hypothetical protein